MIWGTVPPTGESECLALLCLTRILAFFLSVFLGVTSLRRHTEIIVVHRVNSGLTGSEGFPGHRCFRTKISRILDNRSLYFKFEIIIFFSLFINSLRI